MASKLWSTGTGGVPLIGLPVVVALRRSAFDRCESRRAADDEAILHVAALGGVPLGRHTVRFQ